MLRRRHGTGSAGAARLTATSPKCRAKCFNASFGGDQVKQLRLLGFPLVSRAPWARWSCQRWRAVSWERPEQRQARQEAARAGAGLCDPHRAGLGNQSRIRGQEHREAMGKREWVREGWTEKADHNFVGLWGSAAVRRARTDWKLRLWVAEVKRGTVKLMMDQVYCLCSFFSGAKS